MTAGGRVLTASLSVSPAGKTHFRRDAARRATQPQRGLRLAHVSLVSLGTTASRSRNCLRPTPGSSGRHGGASFPVHSRLVVNTASAAIDGQSQASGSRACFRTKSPMRYGPARSLSGWKNSNRHPGLSASSTVGRAPPAQAAGISRFRDTAAEGQTVERCGVDLSYRNHSCLIWKSLGLIQIRAQ